MMGSLNFVVDICTSELINNAIKPVTPKDCAAVTVTRFLLLIVIVCCK